MSHHVPDVEKMDRTSSPDLSIDPGIHHLSGTHLSLDDVQPVHVQLHNLAVSVDTAPSWLAPSTYGDLFSSKFSTAPKMKPLLNSVNADLQPGTLTAIIGGSGSGKTTLLNTVAERVLSSRLSQDGVVTFNGKVGVHNVRAAYVMQQDILLPTLTVRETLRYSADLRLPPSTTAEERHRVVEEVILELGLKECADTRIGNSQHHGCSGGEKRRTSIGVQLLANPSVLFLDEPTTGLDATSAYQLVRTLKTLAQKGRTIITTIHQPRSEIWDLFDNLIVLTKGSPVFSGAIKDAVPWFADLGFQLPPFVNPAEFIIDIAAVDNRTPELEQETSAKVERLKSAWNEETQKRHRPLDTIDVGDGKRKKDKKAEAHAGFVRQLTVLTDRTLKVTYRDPLGMAATLTEAIFMGLVCGYLFFDLGRDQAGIRSRQGGLYTAAGLQGYLILIFEVYRMTFDIPTFDRENSEGCVDALPFVLSRRIARMVTEDVAAPFLFSVIFYFMAGFDRDVEKFFTFFAITLLNQYIAVTCAMTCVATVRHFAGASVIANLVFTLQSMACGMFINVNSLPVYVRWLKWLTYTFYVFSAYCGNEFEGSFYDCPFGDESDPRCKQYTGSYVMASLGFPKDWVTKPILVCLAFVIFFVVLSVIGLHLLKVEMTIARARVSDTDLSAGKEKMTARSVADVRAIDLELNQFSLALDKRTQLGKKLPTKTILNPVNATFNAGVLNVIMGPSGSGKTSLLNSMALRLRNSVGTKYRPAGKLTFNGAVPSDSVIRSVCSYVCQDDDALLPSLTVRETLRFAAGLRLPSFMSKEEKNRRAEDVLLKMGLKDCADNLIGGELVKGISGGEKRRVSIAVQVLTDPRILLLDEPTSGLDAFTANSIMEVLQGLANEGRTLILTIHQARSDLFREFGNVLLLARGGSQVYSGPGKDMLGYLARHGYECPTHTNPADFALDMITIDLQQEGRELESRKRVQKLIDHWKEDSSSTNEKPAGTRDEDIKDTPEQHNSQNTTHRRSFNKANLSTPAELGALIRKRAPITTSLPLLLHRATINTYRQPELIVARLMQVIGLALVLALFFAPFDNDYYSIQNRMGFVQEIGAFYFVGMLQNTAIYPNERDVFYREDDDGVYSVHAFLAAYTILEVPFEIISCMIFGVLGVIAVDLPRTATLYFVSVFACFGIVSCGESLGIMFNTLFGHTGFAVNIMGVFLALANTMAGILSIDMPELFKAFNYLSPIRYGTRAVAPYSLRDITFTCNEEQRLQNGKCPIETGQQVLELYNFDVDPVVNVACLAACVVVYRLLAWGLLKIARTHWKGRKKSDESVKE
ncbi:hypothetical protein LZL87_007206 [Fusarium oxysporum]|nr:hypothetical protein LZL87_007206 [Fusarium oxysporum]